MLFTAHVIELSDDQKVASGTVRSVYEFPQQPELLIKVFHSPENRSPRKPLKRLLWKYFPTMEYRSMLNELKCELLAALKLNGDVRHMPLSRMLGIVQTNRGPGVVVERIAGSDGGLAPQLHRFVKDGHMAEPELNALNAFVRRLYELQIVARDINFSNIVYGTRDGSMACFLIDGYGERNLIPLRSMSKRLNARSLDKQFAKIARRAGLNWDPIRQAFSVSGEAG
ncbi:YrbL family protein [Dinoroseobacter sp. S76]|uniref:YrbL family protein n=1 Tax=Dinoroseobacter sp. S76 TaxID=3415124 RepID=UPI003C7A015E